MRFLSLRHTALGFALETAVRRTRHETPARLPHWHADPRGSPTSESVLERLDALLRRPAVPRPAVKGHPDPNEPKLRVARQLRERLEAGEDAEALALAHRLAALDMSDPGPYMLLLELVSLLSAPALSAARSVLKPDVIAHVSCVARLDRAFASSESFAEAESDRLSQIVIVGSAQAHDFRFDPASRVLTVPADDSYEHLPSKVIAAMSFLSLCGGVEGVLKVDDDHRLNSRSELMRGFRRLAYGRPLQIGQLSRGSVLGLHPRAWHFGKTSDPRLSLTPYTLPGTTRWANGANGYYLNDLALRVLLWSYVYFPGYIRIGLYEDMTVSDLIERQGGRLGSMQMERAVTAVHHY
jgi:hypothetical protein